jgi:hypothetical protein
VEEQPFSQNELRDDLTKAFIEAYPDLPPDKATHMARNLAQVIIGVIEIGEKVGNGSDITHMDVANTFVYWCVANTYLEDLYSGKEHDPPREEKKCGSDHERPSDQEMKKLLSGFVARAADLFIGMEVLAKNQVLYESFIKGSVGLFASSWERDREKLEY